MSDKVAIVAGVGEGTGASLARRFHADGYRVALLARDLAVTQRLAEELDGAGRPSAKTPISAKAYACDVGDADSVAATVAAVQSDLGTIEVLLYNAGGGTFGGVDQITPAQFEATWRVCALGSLLLSQAVLPAMRASGHGSIVFTGATASRRGSPGSAAFAPAKAAQRALAESMARGLWPEGVHVALIVVDGVIDIPRTRKRMPDKPESFFLKPDAIAAIAAHLVAQDRSAWSFEVEARPFGETW